MTNSSSGLPSVGELRTTLWVDDAFATVRKYSNIVLSPDAHPQVRKKPDRMARSYVKEDSEDLLVAKGAMSPYPRLTITSNQG